VTRPDLSPADLAAAFERAVLSSLGVSEPPVERWAEAYRRLSSALTQDRAALASAPSAAIAGPDALGVTGLVFAARTLQIARRILRAYPAPNGRFVEVGAGWGPFGLAASLSGSSPIELRDLVRAPLERATAAFRSLDLEAPRTVVGHGDAVSGPASGIALAFSWNEMIAGTSGSRRIERGAEILRRLMSALEPGGRLYVLEPGLRETSRTLQAVRDVLVGEGVHVLAPCPHRAPCPRLLSDRDWCHLTWPIEIGPWGRAIADRAYRNRSEVHFSWLVLSKEAEKIAPAPVRLLEVNARGPRFELGTCSARGSERLVALRRDPALIAQLESLEPGALVEVDHDALEPKGDGLRLRSVDSLRLVRPL
jgi:hypothetical protein